MDALRTAYQRVDELESVPEDMRNTIMEQKDLDILSFWHKSAVKAKSLDEWNTMVEWK